MKTKTYNAVRLPSTLTRIESRGDAAPARWRQLRMVLAIFIILTPAGIALAQKVLPPLPPPPPPSCRHTETHTESLECRCSYSTRPWFGLKPDAQPTSGSITDEMGQPILAVKIDVIGADGKAIPMGTLSDVEGHFEVYFPADKSLRLECSHIGYETWEAGLDEITSPLRITLKTKVYDLPLVEVVWFKVPPMEWDCLTSGGYSYQEIDVLRESFESNKNSGHNYEYDNSNTPLKAFEGQPETVFPESVYPNPFLSELNVKLTTETDAATLFHLYNAAGQLVFAQAYDLPSGNNVVTLNLGGRKLPAGAYFLRISDAAGEIRTKQVIKAE